MDVETNLVWIDLEMTGLNPEQDVIVEIASIITDSNLRVIAEGPSLVIHQPMPILERMDDWVKKIHTQSGLTSEILESTVTLAGAEEQTLAFIKAHCQEKKALLCGNSVWQDKVFLQKYMPRITQFLFYRIIDVSSVKEIVTRWYPNDPHAFYKKPDTHRALPDIRESIAELRHYRKYFFV